MNRRWRATSGYEVTAFGGYRKARRERGKRAGRTAHCRDGGYAGRGNDQGVDLFGVSA